MVSRSKRDLRAFWRWYFLLLSLILIFLGQTVVSNSSEDSVEATVVEDELIVMFNHYMEETEQRSVLNTILSDETGWEVVERNNPAKALPSDFALLKVSEHKERIENALKKSVQIKHAFPQKRFVNSLKSFEDEEEVMEEREDDPYRIRNMLGRAHAPFSTEEEQTEMRGRRRLHSTTVQVTHMFNADFLWDKMYTGTGVRVAIFDTGLGIDSRFRNIRDRTNWTDEKTLDDGLGHGTFVAGVIASDDDLCPGFAPDVDIYVFRVFTNSKVSYTSWFLDAFNYAIHSKINVLNLSIGGPDFMDVPFVEKVWEMSANNIIVVSAIGNDGPLYGTLNNPADQPDVIGVGGIDFNDKIAAFSSRGMTTWELPSGYGRVKPDIVAYGQSVSGSRLTAGCRTLSGTSVASPVVAGAVSLLLSTVPENRRDMVNPASMKQALIESAELVPGANIFEQGMGKLNLLRAYEILSTYKPRASALPSSLDLTLCPYMWPYCSQPLYYGAIPIAVNITILNGMGVSGKMAGPPRWIAGTNGHFLEVSFSYPEIFWPWTGNLGLHIRVAEEAAAWEGVAEGLLEFTVVSPPNGPREREARQSTIEIPVKVNIIPTPPRNRRILWDQFHNLRYPSGYFPRDALWVKNEPFDWNGDHIHTNFRDMYTHMRSLGYFVEVLGEPYTCFNASQYGVLMIVDPEDEFFPQEIKKIQHDVKELGLSVVVFADWYNVDVMKKIKFFDENTKQLWTPATGGANIPALNDLLSGFGIEFGDRVYDGEFDSKTLTKSGPDMLNAAAFSSGAALSRFPTGGLLVSLELQDQTTDILNNKVRHDTVPVLGLLRVRDEAGRRDQRAGRIVVFGDSSCLDNANKKLPCFPLVDKVLGFASDNTIEEAISAQAFVLEDQHQSDKLRPPERIADSDLGRYSKVLNLLPGMTPCSQLIFRRANNTEDREIFWPPLVFSSSSSSSEDGAGGISLPGRRKSEEGSSINKDKGNGDLLQVGYGYAAIPYGLFFLGMFFVVVLALRPRTDQSSQSTSSSSSSSSQAPSQSQQLQSGYSSPYSYPAYGKSSNV